ncbi:calcineurin-like phosphoesterase family protein [Candidatus Sumerlaeota bacterium]|nr:calcineurin-like phosphoesterase family protein [Candidatus Sumerlaeota bacterium]
MKEIVRFRIMILAFCLFLMLIVLPGETIRGYVFLDANRNNSREASEPGVPNVLVSNGLDVTPTGAKGKYELNIFGDAVIFITKPDGFATPESKWNLPLFYYIHRPIGSPSSRYKGCDSTGPLPSSLDFPLRKTESLSEFEALAFADTQPRNLKELAYVRDDVINGVIGSNAAFGIVLGDILFNDLSFFDEYKDIISKIGIPFYHIPGNHDTNQDAPDDQYSMETYIRHFGPPYYSFDFGQVHFVVLDNIDWIGPREGHRGRYEPRLGEKQLKWLENDLKHVDHSKLVVICCHIPIKNMRNAHEPMLMKDMESLLKILEGRENILFLAGHTHTLRHHYLDHDDGWKGAKPIHQITCGTISGCWWGGPKDVDGIPVAVMSDGAPNGYHLFHFKGNSYSEKYIPARFDDEFQMQISSPPVEIMRDEIPDHLVVVNIFNGSVKNYVECRIDDSYTTEMTYVIRTDPYMEQLIQNNKDSFGSSFNPRVSFHIWQSPLPQNLKEGLHTITIKTTDQYGQKFQGSKIFRIE